VKWRAQFSFLCRSFTDEISMLLTGLVQTIVGWSRKSGIPASARIATLKCSPVGKLPAIGGKPLVKVFRCFGCKRIASEIVILRPQITKAGINRRGAIGCTEPQPPCSTHKLDFSGPQDQ
jgi:hypothetical protein